MKLFGVASLAVVAQGADNSIVRNRLGGFSDRLSMDEGAADRLEMLRFGVGIAESAGVPVPIQTYLPTDSGLPSFIGEQPSLLNSDRASISGDAGGLGDMISSSFPQTGSDEVDQLLERFTSGSISGLADSSAERFELSDENATPSRLGSLLNSEKQANSGGIMENFFASLPKASDEVETGSRLSLLRDRNLARSEDKEEDEERTGGVLGSLLEGRASSGGLLEGRESGSLLEGRASSGGSLLSRLAGSGAEGPPSTRGDLGGLLNSGRTSIDSDLLARREEEAFDWSGWVESTALCPDGECPKNSECRTARFSSESGSKCKCARGFDLVLGGDGDPAGCEDLSAFEIEADFCPGGDCPRRSLCFDSADKGRVCACQEGYVKEIERDGDVDCERVR